MSCVMRISGEDLVLEDLLRLMPAPYAQWHKGEAQRYIEKVETTSGAKYDVSVAGFKEFEEQKTDALVFLLNHREALRMVAQLPGIRYMQIDFGIEDRDSFTQSDSFEPELLKIAGELNITIKLSRYPISKDDDTSSPKY